MSSIFPRGGAAVTLTTLSRNNGTLENFLLFGRFHPVPAIYNPDDHRIVPD
jgi:hypothetical protein